MQLPNFGAHNKQVYLALLGGAILLGIYLRRRSSSSSSSSDPTVGDATDGTTPDLSGLENYTPGDGTVTTAGGAPGPQGPPGPPGKKGPRGPKGPPPKHKPPPKKHHPKHHSTVAHEPRTLHQPKFNPPKNPPKVR